MLFKYPIEATIDNWLHECLCEILRSIHTSLQTAQTPPAWPAIIPALYRARLARHFGLRDRLDKYRQAAEALTPSARDRILQALDDQNKIAFLLSGQCGCEVIGDLPSPIQQPVKELFRFGFILLTDLGVRDSHFATIYREIPYPVCPFCGCEYFDAPDAPREALDHFLPASRYPFAAANLRNLVPMGNKCNSRYKLAQDILYSDDGRRRKSFDPYDHGDITVSLDNSKPFAGTDGKLPLWQIDLIPVEEETTTWDDVFRVRERYQRDVLDPCFKRWLGEFRAWCISRSFASRSDAELIDALDYYANYHEDLRFNDRSFLKAAVYRMLHKHCLEGDTRLLSFIKDVVGPGGSREA